MGVLGYTASNCGYRRDRKGRFSMASKNGVLRRLESALASCAVVLTFCGLNDTVSAVVYSNVTAAAGINHVQNVGPGVGSLVMTGGAAAGDFDNDGWVDIFVTRLDAPDILYRNKGDGTFENVSTAAGFTANLPTNSPAWGDIDNDGDLDLYVTAIINPTSPPARRLNLNSPIASGNSRSSLI